MSEDDATEGQNYNESHIRISLAARCLSMDDVLQIVGDFVILGQDHRFSISPASPRVTLLALARSCRTTYDILMPVIIRDVFLGLNDLFTFADLLARRPYLARHCRSLGLCLQKGMQFAQDRCSSLSVNWTAESIDEYLVLILEAVGKQGGLQAFSLLRPPSHTRNTFAAQNWTGRFSKNVWHALEMSSETLEVLDIRCGKELQWFFHICSSFSFKRLKYLALTSGDGWAGLEDGISTFINRCQDLRNLHLVREGTWHTLPEGQDGLMFSLPHLQAAEINCDDFTEHFVRSHSGLKYLTVRGIISRARADVRHPKTIELPSLAALSPKIYGLANIPALAIRALQCESKSIVRHIRMDAHKLSRNRQFLVNMRCVELIIELHSFYGEAKVLRSSVASMVELGLIISQPKAYDGEPIGDAMGMDMLTRLMKEISEIESLRALRICQASGNEDTLPDTFALEHRPPQLRFLLWETAAHGRCFYRSVQTASGCNMVKMGRDVFVRQRGRRRDPVEWYEESIYDHTSGVDYDEQEAAYATLKSS